MLRVRDIMATDLATVSPELELREAMDLLSRRHVTGAPVVSNGSVLGVVSATDMLEFAAGEPGVPAERPDQVEVGELEAPEEWEEGEAPPSAYFSELWTDAGADVDERFAAVQGPEWDMLAGHTVAEVMTRKVCSVPPELPVAAAAEYMLRFGVHRVVVLDGRKLVGILTTTDIVRAVAQGRLAEP